MREGGREERREGGREGVNEGGRGETGREGGREVEIYIVEFLYLFLLCSNILLLTYFITSIL